MGLCSSRRCPAGVLLLTAQWAIGQREAGVGVASWLQTRLELAALRYLLAPVLHGGAAPPVVWVLAHCPGPVLVPHATPGGALAQELARGPGRWVGLAE